MMINIENKKWRVQKMSVLNAKINLNNVNHQTLETVHTLCLPNKQKIK